MRDSDSLLKLLAAACLALLLAASAVPGVGVFKHDCGSNCVQQAVPATYYGCAGSTCTSLAVAEDLQVANPIPYFATDNNGSILMLPAVASGGEASLSGQLVFGIGTQSNNGLGSAQVIGVSPSDGTFATSTIFDWGMPFFYGRNVYAAVEQQSTPGGTGPYIAY